MENLALTTDPGFSADFKLPDHVQLVRRPTPVDYLKGISARLGQPLYAWREDLTGCLLSGNKVRKLEYLLAEALREGADTVITCGGPQSNHARATAWAARSLGLDCEIIVREPAEGLSETKSNQGNALLMRLAQSRLTRVHYDDYVTAGGTYTPFLGAAREVALRQGRRPYVIPEGGSNALGALGYVTALAELKEVLPQELRSKGPNNLFTAVGSGGTLAGLSLGVAALGWQSQVIGINVCNDPETFLGIWTRLTREAVERFGLPTPPPPTICGGFVGLGYARTTNAELDFYKDIVAEDGLLLDPVYTGKAFRGMCYEISAGHYDGSSVFVHTGGQFAHFAFLEEWHDAGL